MQKNLYNELKAIDAYDDMLKQCQYKLNLDLSDFRHKAFQTYDNNPILDHALSGRKTIEETLEEMSGPNARISKLLPWKKDEEHNKMVRYLGQLVRYPQHLETKGMLSLDNAIAGVVCSGIFAGIVAGAYAAMSEISPEVESLGPDSAQLGTVLTSISSPLLALGFTMRRDGDLPIDQARYIDEKIRELYTATSERQNEEYF